MGVTTRMGVTHGLSAGYGYRSPHFYPYPCSALVSRESGNDGGDGGDDSGGDAAATIAAAARATLRTTIAVHHDI